MLSRRPSNGLYTYNFELDRLRVTTLDSATSLALDESEYSTKLVLTLRQFRDAPRRAAKKVEGGYLFILHSGTNAIERLDLRKFRQSVSPGAAPSYRIRAEGCGIVFQYLCGDSKIRKISIEFRKQGEYQRALQILLSQGLAVTIAKPEHGRLNHSSIVPAIPGSPQLDLLAPSLPAQQSTASHIPGAWTAPPIGPSYFPLREERTLSTQMPPPAVRNVGSNKSPPASGYYHSRGLYSPRFTTSGYYTPTHGQSQPSEKAFPGHGWLPSQQLNPSFNHTLSTEPLPIGRIPGPPPIAPNPPPSEAMQYGTPQSFLSSQSCRDPPFPEQGVLPPAAQQQYNQENGVDTQNPMTKMNLDSMLPPPRALPFKPKKASIEPQSARSLTRVREGQLDANGTRSTRWETQRNMSYMPTILGAGMEGTKGLSVETNRGGNDGNTLPETHGTATEASNVLDTNQGRAVDNVRTRFEYPTLPAKNVRQQADSTFLHASQVEDVGGPPSDVALLGIFRTLEYAVELWRMGLRGDPGTDLEEVLLNLRYAAQRLDAHLHPRNLDSRNDGHIDDHKSAPMRIGKSPVIIQSAPTIIEPHTKTERRHTREYKQWKEYYLFACRLYETKEERTDAEFIHRFLRGMPSKRALRWVQMGLLHCYPSMVRLSDRRSGTTILFTRDLRWSHVCEMVTRKLKLPFEKWEMVRAA